MSVIFKRKFPVAFASAARAAGSAQASSEVVTDDFAKVSMLVDLTAIAGSPSATALDVKIQYSPDTSGSRWIDLPNGAITQLTTTGRQQVSEKPLMNARRIQVVYTLAFTGGTNPTATFAVDLVLSQL